MEKIDDLVAMVVAVREELERGIAVGISGIDCAGKSTLAESLRRRLERDGVPVLVIAGDEFTRPTAERYAEPDQGVSYYRDSFDYRWLFDRLLPALRAGFDGELGARVSDWERDAWRPATFVIPTRAVVLVEGCFLFTEEHADAFDVCVWIDLPLARAVERALKRPRDLERMGGPDGVRARYASRYLPGQQLHLDRDAPKQRAHILVGSADMVSG